MATYSSNTTIKIGQTVSFYRNFASSGVIFESYTVPSGSYLKVVRSSFSFSGGGNAYIRITYPGGHPFENLQIPDSFEYSTDSTPPGTLGPNPLDLLLPSGTLIELAADANAPLRFASYRFVGQLYSNTP